jgi:uncharacterized membrane protein
MNFLIYFISVILALYPVTILVLAAHFGYQAYDKGACVALCFVCVTVSYYLPLVWREK